MSRACNKAPSQQCPVHIPPEHRTRQEKEAGATKLNKRTRKRQGMAWQTQSMKGTSGRKRRVWGAGRWEMGDGGGERTLRCLLLTTAIAWGEKSWSRSTSTVSISPGPAAACAYLRPAQYTTNAANSWFPGAIGGLSTPKGWCLSTQACEGHRPVLASTASPIWRQRVPFALCAVHCMAKVTPEEEDWGLALGTLALGTLAWTLALACTLALTGSSGTSLTRTSGWAEP